LIKSSSKALELSCRVLEVVSQIGNAPAKISAIGRFCAASTLFVSLFLLLIELLNFVSLFARVSATECDVS
jgi:hypothetical protein